MLLLVLILVLIAFGLLVVALLTGSVLSAWLSVAVSVAAAVVLVIDWLQRRSAVKAGRAGADGASPATTTQTPPADIDPVTEVLPVYPPDSDPSAETVVSEPKRDRPPDGQRTVVMPAVQPSGSAARPSGAEDSSTPSGGSSSHTVTVGAADAGPGDNARSGPDDRIEAATGTPPDRSDAEATVVVDIRKAGIGGSSAGPASGDADTASGAGSAEGGTGGVDRAAGGPQWTVAGERADAGVQRAADGERADIGAQRAADAERADAGAQRAPDAERADAGAPAAAEHADTDQPAQASSGSAGAGARRLPAGGLGSADVSASDTQVVGAVGSGGRTESGPNADPASRPDRQSPAEAPAVPSAASGVGEPERATGTSPEPAGEARAAAEPHAESPAAIDRPANGWEAGPPVGEGRPAGAWATGAAAASGATGRAADAIDKAAEHRPTDAQEPEPTGGPSGARASGLAVDADSRSVDERAVPPSSPPAEPQSSVPARDDQITRAAFGAEGNELFAAAPPSDSAEATTVMGAAGSAQQGSTPATEDGEPPEEPVERVLAGVVASAEDEVLVIDEQPRYHLMGCRALLAKETIPLPVREAVELGFTPCGWCKPAAALGARHPASARP